MKKLLLVEDNKGFLEILKNLLCLHLESVTIVTAENGENAMKCLDSNRVDLIVTDLQMPVRNGYDLMEFRNREYPHIPVIGMTADLTPEVEIKLESLGVQRFLAKPFDIRRMVEAITLELGKRLQQNAPGGNLVWGGND